MNLNTTKANKNLNCKRTQFNQTFVEHQVITSELDMNSKPSKMQIYPEVTRQI